MMIGSGFGFGLRSPYLSSQQDKRKKMTLRKALTDAITIAHPELSQQQTNRLLDRYIPSVLNEIHRAMLRPINDLGEYSFSRLSAACGIITLEGRRYPVHKFMDLDISTQMVVIGFLGNQGRYTRVSINDIYKEHIMNELIPRPAVDLTAAQQRRLDSLVNHQVLINTASLMDFIQHSRTQAEVSQGRRQEKIVVNLKRAQQILAQSQNTPEGCILAEYRETADSGRQYGHGISLQTVSKEVRHAALGPCHMYDFQAHSFAVMASIARVIDPGVQVSQITDYIKYRASIRKRIATQVGVSEATIKSIFTSLGFGARTANNPFNSLRQLLPDQAAYERLMAQREFQYIVQERDQINQVILRHPYFSGDFVGESEYRYTEHETDDQGRTRLKVPNRRLSWIYQNAEAFITNEFIRIITERTGQTPLTTVHDCVYYAQPIPAQALLDVQTLIRETYEFVRVEHTAIWPIGTQESYDDRFSQEKQWEQQHQQHILAEEALATGYVSGWTTPVTTTHRHSGMISEIERHADLPDYTEYEYQYSGE